MHRRNILTGGTALIAAAGMVHARGASARPAPVQADDERFMALAIEEARLADYPFGADTWHQRTVIQTTSDTTMTATSYLSFGSVPEWKGVEIRYTRRR